MAWGESTPDFKSWQCPPEGVAESTRLGWLDEATQEGIAWLKSQRGAADFNRSLDTISGRTSAAASDYRSKVAPNRLKRDIREVVGTLAKLRPIWGYHSDNTAFKPFAGMMNNVTRAIYLEQFFDLRIKDALKYAAATGRGWIHPVYRRGLAGTGTGNIELDVFGAPSVLPVQLPSSGDFQKAYAVSILDEWPVYMAHGMFPSAQHLLKPSSSAYWYASTSARTAVRGNVFQRIFGQVRRTSGDAATQSQLLVPIRKTYVIDLTINTTKTAIPMGDIGSTWSYTVPYIGQDIPDGRTPTGEPKFRKANENDARLYPYRRLLMSSDTTILYDGPAFDWHGMFPAVSFCPDSWPWEPIGFPLTHGTYEMNQAVQQIYRGNMDKIAAGLDPSIGYDTNAVTLNEARKIDPMMPRGRFGFDGNASEPGKPPWFPALPSEFTQVDPHSLEMAQMLETRIDNELSLGEMMNLAKVRGVGSLDELDKAMEINGPIVEEMSRGMEPPMRDLGVMLKYQICQNFTTSRVMQYVGADGVTPEVFDYDPTSLIPSHIPGEDVVDAEGNNVPSAHSQITRARIFADNLRFFILPNTLHEIAQMSMKLALLQMKKVGVMMDSQTIGDAFSVPNYGTIPGNTVIEKYWAEQEQQLIHSAKLMAAQAGITALFAPPDTGDGATAPPAPPAPPPNGAQPPGAPAPGGGESEGRPPSFNKPPVIESKDNGTRTTIATS